ncbi:hypothetical protein F4678DRAFT_465038 [Xylaria arbuscula]|nr:hypothetical protein F4678DRAFT_465038 [Xylaria arbuscula]
MENDIKVKVEDFEFGRACLAIQKRMSERANIKRVSFDKGWNFIVRRAILLEISEAEGIFPLMGLRAPVVVQQCICRRMWKHFFDSDPVPWADNETISFGKGEEMEINLMKAALEVSYKDVKVTLRMLSTNSIDDEASRLLKLGNEKKESAESVQVVNPFKPTFESSSEPAPKPARVGDFGLALRKMPSPAPTPNSAPAPAPDRESALKLVQSNPKPTDSYSGGSKLATAPPTSSTNASTIPQKDLTSDIKPVISHQNNVDSAANGTDKTSEVPFVNRSLNPFWNPFRKLSSWEIEWNAREGGMNKRPQAPTAAKAVPGIFSVVTSGSNSGNTSQLVDHKPKHSFGSGLNSGSAAPASKPTGNEAMPGSEEGNSARGVKRKSDSVDSSLGSMLLQNEEMTETVKEWRSLFTPLSSALAISVPDMANTKVTMQQMRHMLFTCLARSSTSPDRLEIFLNDYHYMGEWICLGALCDHDRIFRPEDNYCDDCSFASSSRCLQIKKEGVKTVVFRVATWEKRRRLV